MKKFSLMVLAAISVFSTLALYGSEEQLATIEDKPALTKAEQAALVGAKAVGAFGGSIGGLFTTNVIPPKYRHAKIPGTEYTFSGVPALGIGGYAGYRGAEAAAIYALAKLHGVSYRVEAVSQYYDINFSQYGQMLLEAEQEDADVLIQAISTSYTLRFGSDWHKRLVHLFKKYDKRAEQLMKLGRRVRNKEIRDFLRMMKLGAAMADLYYGTNPSRKNTVDSATLLYKDLGLLQ